MQRFGIQQFSQFRNFIYDKYGIYFSDAKNDILRNKLNKLMIKNNYSSYDEYFNDLQQGKYPGLLSEFANAITVNYTSFFREKDHFEFLKAYAGILTDSKNIDPSARELRVWSAACSTGEEAYTLAIVLSEALQGSARIRLLATDISNKAVSIAQKGTYPSGIRNDVGSSYLNKYFREDVNGYMVSESIKKLITFRSFNLMDAFPFKKTFDLIFCRNVMIYFDASVRQKLIGKLYDATSKGGLLIIGHSESLTGQKHSYRYLRPAVYIKD
ncbi:MAG TPA: protein-glutamate O-methyltransferase CheR [Clostridia bacterium]|nr:protein-glutamate O-methyltransferase CheR [Clostridia bacterium]